MKNLILSSLMVLTVTIINASTIIVTNTNDSGPGSLRQAISDAGLADEIRFDPSLISGGSSTILLTSEIVVSKGLYINGLYNSNDTLYISGNNTNRVFNCEVTSTLFANISLDSLVIVDALVSANGGGAIRINAVNPPTGTTHYLTNCIFKNNIGLLFGAVYMTSGNLQLDAEIVNCKFDNNQVTGPNNTGGAGVYIGINGSGTTVSPTINLLVDRCNFSNNSSSRFGAAIYLATSSSTSSSNCYTNLTVKNSSFVGNNAVTEGGAIYMKADENNGFSYVGVSTIDVESSTFSNNSADENGGAVFLTSSYNSIVNVKNSTIIDNNVFLEGSAIYAETPLGTSTNQSSINISSSIIANNAGNFNNLNSIKLNSDFNDFRSEGYNFFDFPVSHVPDYTHLGGAADIFDVSSVDLNLAPLSYNSFGTQSRIPNTGSVVANAGNPNDNSPAQNAPILGVRDAGAAESDICATVPNYVSVTICQGSSYDFYGQILTSPGTYTHMVVSPGACDTLVTLTLETQIPFTPSISISANPGNTIMTGTSVTLTANTSNGGTSPTYQWSVNGTNVGTNSPVYVSSTLTNGAQVTCILTSSEACVNPSNVESNTITFTVHPNNDEPCNAIPLDVNTSCVTEYFANHIATSTTNVGPHTCANSTSKDIWFSFQAPASGNVYIFTYAGTLLDAVMSVYLGPNCSSLFEVGCIDDDGTNQMPQGQVLGATPDTTYYIRVSSYGTTASGNFSICLVDPGNLQGLVAEESNTFQLAPNPSTGEFDLSFSDPRQRTITVYTMTGSLVREVVESEEKVHLSLNELTEGIYTVKVADGSTISVRKVVINR